MLRLSAVSDKIQGIAIEKFKSRPLQRFAETGEERYARKLGVPKQYHERLLKILHRLASAHPLDGFSGSSRLHPLQGNLKGLWAVTLFGSRRIVFRFENGDVYDVDLVDYHE